MTAKDLNKTYLFFLEFENSTNYVGHFKADHCELKLYNAEEANSCFNDKTAWFIGDSRTRQFYYGISKLLNQSSEKTTFSID